MSHHPEPISVVAIIKSIDRRSESGARKAITALWKEKQRPFDLPGRAAKARKPLSKRDRAERA
jgi:hypothetical protein